MFPGMFSFMCTNSFYSPFEVDAVIHILEMEKIIGIL